MPTEFFLDKVWLIPLFPLAGAALMLLAGKRLQNSAVSVVCVGSVFVSFVFSLGAVWQLLERPAAERVAQKILFEWVPAGLTQTSSGKLVNFVAEWGLLLDPLSAVMILVVTGVGFLIHFYSIGYMAHEGGYYRFFGYMNLFMFSMLTLVLANNMLLMFVGWEGVGLCSYLLIGFYFLRKSAADAGKKAFIVNRVGDAGFLLGIFLTVGTLGTIKFTEFAPALAAGHFAVGAPVITAIALLLFVGATGKSAQIPLYVWLPDAMEGPTPVSALIHAFFKALLFLGSGSVIHALSGEQDIRKMGALWEKIPTTAKTFLIATLAIAGIPPFAGFFSKDEILGKTLEHSPALWGIGILTAGMTAFYMFRLVNMTFFGASRVPHDVEHHIHESPRTMTVPLMILAALSVVGGWIGWPASLGGSNRFEHFLDPVIARHGAEHVEAAAVHGGAIEYALMLASVLIALAGIWLARLFYIQRTDLPAKLASSFSGLYQLVYRKYYMDEVYDALFVNRAKDLGTTLALFDAKVIDGLGVDGTGWLMRFTSRVSIWWDTWIVDGLVNLAARVVWLFSYPVRMVQTGLVSSYALLIVFGVLVVLGYYGYLLRTMLR